MDEGVETITLVENLQKRLMDATEEATGQVSWEAGSLPLFPILSLSARAGRG